MGYAVVLNALTEYSPGGTVDYRESLLRKTAQLASKKDIYVVATTSIQRDLGSVAEGFGRITVRNRTAAHVLGQIHRALKDYTEFIYLYIDTPLLDLQIARKMLELHRDEIAEYTYGEGFPVGVAPEVLNVDLLPKLLSLLDGEGMEVERGSIFKILQKQINSFDIETYFSPRDMALRRIELTLSPGRNRVITERVIEKEGIDCSFERFCELVEKEPVILRSLPSYVEVEITNRVNHVCPYMPHEHLKRKEGEIGFEQYREILDKLVSFSDDLYLSFSYLGEPLLHGEIRGFVEYTLKYPGIKLIIESDGHLFTPDVSDWAANLGGENLHFIFDVDAVQADTYRTIHNGDLHRVERNIRYLLSKQSAHVYVQMVRMDGNEQEMLQFYDQWEKDGAQVIIQKYNTYLGLLPARSSSDLKPLDRQPCWHLMRDLVIFHDGTVPRCKQDINAEFVLGNLCKDTVEAVWEANTRFYLEHCSGTYDRHCAVCDEYYTFNF